MSKGISQAMRVVMRCDRSAPRLAREAVLSLDAIETVRDDALLLASELVSNAVLHAGCDSGDTIEMIAELEPRTLRITVVDVARPGDTPALREGPITGIGGMGLRLVHTLAQRWGIQRGRQLKVWAELAV
jgi:anti-sigma regulatory factor (Ser/Thr protein kinase)